MARVGTTAKSLVGTTGRGHPVWSERHCYLLLTPPPSWLTILVLLDIDGGRDRGRVCEQCDRLGLGPIPFVGVRVGLYLVRLS